MDALVGDWVLEKNVNFNELLAELGANVLERQLAVRLTTYADIKKVSEDEYALKTVTGPVTKKRDMKFGVEFVDDAPTGGKMTGTWQMEDGRMVGRFAFHKGDKKMTIARYIEDGKLIEIMIVGKVNCKRTFKRR